MNIDNSYFSKNFSNYDVDINGNVYRNGIKMKPFKSEDYLQLLLFDNNCKRRVLGVHQIVAMKYLNYKDGCVVHHIDKNKKNNELSNLQILTKEEHTRLHSKEREPTLVQLKCPSCGKIFITRRNRTHLIQKNRMATFCSRSCSGWFSSYKGIDREFRILENVIDIF